MAAAEEAGNNQIWTIEVNKDLDVDYNNNYNPHHSCHHNNDRVDERMIYYLRKN